MRAIDRKQALVALLATLAFAGCGGGGGSTEAAKPPKPGSNVPRAGGTEVAKVFKKPQKGIPADVGQWMVNIGVDPGGDLAFTVRTVVVPSGNANFQLVNPQAAGHDLTIEEVGRAPSNVPLVRSVHTPVVRRGSAWTRIPLFAGKRYVFYCSVPGHREAGMEGTIRVDPKLHAGKLKAY